MKANMKIFEIVILGNPMSKTPRYTLKIEARTENAAINKVRRMIDSRSSIVNISQL